MKYISLMQTTRSPLFSAYLSKPPTNSAELPESLPNWLWQKSCFWKQKRKWKSIPKRQAWETCSILKQRYWSSRCSLRSIFPKTFDLALSTEVTLKSFTELQEPWLLNLNKSKFQHNSIKTNRSTCCISR